MLLTDETLLFLLTMEILIAAKAYVQILFTLETKKNKIIGKRITLFDQNWHC